MWNVSDNKLVKEFAFESFKQAVEFVNKIQVVADEMNHHPDVFIHDYKLVTVTLTTHEADEITDKDYALSEKIDQL